MRFRRSSPVGRVVWGSVPRSRSSKTMEEFALAELSVLESESQEMRDSQGTCLRNSTSACLVSRSGLSSYTLK
jgi:hypothetical protein